MTNGMPNLNQKSVLDDLSSIMSGLNVSIRSGLGASIVGHGGGSVIIWAWE